MRLEWHQPEDLIPPHEVRDWDKIGRLIGEMFTGWDPQKPPLVGYVHGNKIQLVSGSHRWAVAMFYQMVSPVVVATYREMWDIWGTDRWMEVVHMTPALKEWIP